jgi:hypothetical protein
LSTRFTSPTGLSPAVPNNRPFGGNLRPSAGGGSGGGGSAALQAGDVKPVQMGDLQHVRVGSSQANYYGAASSKHRMVNGQDVGYDTRQYGDR